MLGKLIDLTGQRFGKLVVVSRAENRNGGQSRWLCKCECGSLKEIDGYCLTHGLSGSCGCSKQTHGQSRSRLYHIWQGMKGRCLNSENRDYPKYGGRGIKVFEEWRKSFETFRDWAIANGYRSDLSIDRIDVNGDYCPQNCRWATANEQCNNRRKTIFLLYGGRKQSLSEWSHETGIKYVTLRKRFEKGWPTEKILSKGACRS